jgi:glycine C-acetyltransferase
MEKFHKQMERATKWTKETGGGILVITEGVYGMSGNLGNLKDIVAYKKEFNFRLLVDDAHGFGTMGKDGRGSHVNMNVVDGVDLYFATFAKSMAGIGAFVAGNEDIIKYLRFSLRSQIYAKSLPMPMVIGSLKRLDLIRTRPEFRDKLWVIVRALQKGLRDAGFDIGTTQSPVTPVLFSGDIPQATQLTYDLRENYNIFCSIVSYPVVPKGILMLRLIPTAVHTLEDVEYTIKAFKEIRDKLAAGKYDSGIFAEVNK